MSRRMSRRELSQYLDGKVRAFAQKNLDAASPARFCHTCGHKLIRRIYSSTARAKRANDAKTESKDAFAHRHFCNALCRASCKGSRIATIPKSRFS